MEQLFPAKLLDLLVISVTFSMISMVFIQKCKSMKFVRKKWQVCLLNFLLSFLVGMPFANVFYDVSWLDSIWVGLFTFVGAPSIYDALKNQKIFNYKPSSLQDTIAIPKENEIMVPKDD